MRMAAKLIPADTADPSRGTNLAADLVASRTPMRFSTATTNSFVSALPTSVLLTREIDARTIPCTAGESSATCSGARPKRRLIAGIISMRMLTSAAMSGPGMGTTATTAEAPEPRP